MQHCSVMLCYILVTLRVIFLVKFTLSYNNDDLILFIATLSWVEYCRGGIWGGVSLMIFSQGSYE